MFNYRKYIHRLSKFFYSLSAALMIASLLSNLVGVIPVSAGAGSIWTTDAPCSETAPQNRNSFMVGETVYIHGENFDPNSPVTWDITKPGSPGVIASGTGTTDALGAFCVTGHTIQPGEDGVYKYQVTVNNSSNLRYPWSDHHL
jgi:hypothetical protein